MLCMLYVCCNAFLRTPVKCYRVLYVGMCRIMVLVICVLCMYATCCAFVLVVCTSCFICALTCRCTYLRRWRSLQTTTRTSCSTHAGIGDTDATRGHPAWALRALSSGVPESTGLWTSGTSHYYGTPGFCPLPACWTWSTRFSLMHHCCPRSWTVGDRRRTPSTSGGGR